MEMLLISFLIILAIIYYQKRKNGLGFIMIYKYDFLLIYLLNQLLTLNFVISNPYLKILLIVTLFFYLSYQQQKRTKKREYHILIKDGKINYHNLVQKHYSLRDLLTKISKLNIEKTEEIQYAFLDDKCYLHIILK